MNVSLGEAIRIYAKAMHSWFGERAEMEANQTSVQLEKAGDKEGAQVWKRVAESARKLRKTSIIEFST